jgi:glycosyltransferase involved in cell wall biosynthesis
MKIGIFLGYAPNVVLKKEGLGRYVANLISGFIESDNKIIIACPKWSIPHINELLDDFSIDKSLIEFVISSKVSSMWKLYDKFSKRYERSNNRGWLSLAIRTVLESIIMGMISITNIFLLISAIIIIIMVGIIILPLIVFGLILYGIFRIGLRLLKRTKVKFLNDIYLKSIGKNFKNSGYNFYLYVINFMQENATADLVRKINMMSNKADIWYSPSFFWKEFNKIEGVKVINAPDLVTAEFSELFSYDIYAVLTLENIKITINEGSNFITYCDFIKDSLLLKKFNKDSENVISIPHGVNSMNEFIQIETYETMKLNAGTSFSEAFARNKLQTLPLNKYCLPYMGTFVFENTKYLFYASQLRPHKNILNLVKAYENILRKRYYNIKLVLTCNLEGDSDVKEYILDKRLQKDILSFQNVSNQQLAALYYCAELVVNPTLYEGGFPFTFGEGMSVSTPSVMSRIPQVEDMVCGYELEQCLFDPFDLKDMENTIIYGLENRKELLEKQSKLFNDLNKRTWKVVANEYIEAFQTFILNENTN